MLSMIKELVFEILFNMPKFVKRWIYSKKEFMNDVVIDTTSSNPISFSLNTEVPVARIWLKINNKSQYLDAMFDRAVLLDVYISGRGGQRCILHHKPIILRKRIPKKKDAEIFSEFELNQNQTESLKKVDISRNLTANLRIQYYIDSDLYSFFKIISLDGRPCELNR